MTFGLVVEGFGDVEAAPILVRRLAASIAPHIPLEVLKPFRLSRHKMVKPGELDRAIELMARRTGPDGGVIVLLDADDDCPAVLGPRLLAHAKAARADRHVAIILANREFEAWFLAGAVSLRGRRTLPDDLMPPSDPEGIRGAKEWLSARMVRGYSETLDQPALVDALDLQAARRADSFDKLVRDVCGLLGVATPDRSV